MAVLSDRQIEAEVKIEPFDDGAKKVEQISSGLSAYGYDAKCGYKFQVFSPITATVIDPKKFDPKVMVEINLTPEEHDWCRMISPDDYDRCRSCGLEEHKDEHEHDQGRDNICPKSKPDHILVPPHSFVLAESFETFTIPRDVLCVVLGKSSYARCGLVLNCTPGEPEWTGKWTIELSNTTQLPIKVYAGEGIMQCIFLRSDEQHQMHLKAVLTKAKYTDFGLAQVLKLAQKASCRTSYADKKGKYMHQSGVTVPFVEKK